MPENTSKFLPDVLHGPLSQSLPEALPGLNVGDGLRRATGRPDRYLSLLMSFRSYYRHCLPELTEVLVAQDCDAALAFVHKLKGTAGNIGAQDVFEICVALEQAIRTRQDTAVLQRQFERAWRQLLNTLRTLIPTPDSCEIDGSEQTG